MKSLIIKGHEFLYFESIDSTNNFAKDNIHNLQDGTLIVSETQEGGRGRRGNSWSSPIGVGLYMSIVLKPHISSESALGMVQLIALSLQIAIEELTGLNAQIKWPNDIVINGKKVSGILMETSANINNLDYIIVGIGINVNNKIFNEDIKEKATSLLIEKGIEIDKSQLLVMIMRIFDKFYKDYIETEDLSQIIVNVKRHSAILGREILIVRSSNTLIARAVDINQQGYLIVESNDGNRHLITSGEISIRGLNSYI